jgi:hypothetical protein
MLLPNTNFSPMLPSTFRHYPQSPPRWTPIKIFTRVLENVTCLPKIEIIRYNMHFCTYKSRQKPKSRSKR